MLNLNSISIPTTVYDSEELSQAEIYPNPATDHITIPSGSGETAFLEIRNAFGRLMNRFEVNSNQHQLDISHLPPGLYIADVRSGNKWWLGKFVKM